MMEKMDGMSMDLTATNIEKLKELFPNAVAEGKIDFDMLRTMLGDEVDASKEKYQFTWNGKAESIKLAQSPSSATLRPCKEKSKNWDATENLYIEGDNLEVLKQLQKTYFGKIKMIYIDPPYNTGNDFVYKDDFKNSIENYKEQTNQTNKSNPETSGRFHSDWLSMMYPRLILSRNLLTEDGVIFISIDDREADNLKKMCDEVFGPSQFVANISWQRTYSPRNDSKGISSEVEHIIAFSKSPDWRPGKLPRTEKMDSVYKNPDNDVLPWRNSDAFAPSAITHQGMVYAIQHPITGEYIYPYDGACWPLEQTKMLEEMSKWAEYALKDIQDDERRAKVCGITSNEVRKGVKAIVLNESLESSREKGLAIYKRGQWPRFFFTKNGYGGIARKTYLDPEKGRVVTNFWAYSDAGHTDEAKKEIVSLFDGRKTFDTPKPTRLIERIITIASDSDDIILDYFSGSATTAQAVMKRSNEDGKRRKFILVQLPEMVDIPGYNSLCSIGEERIRLAGEKIKADWIESHKQRSLLEEEKDFQTDIGFKVFALDSTNINLWDNTNEYDESSLFSTATVFKLDRSNEDVLYEIMLKYGVFDQPASEVNINGKTMYRVGQRHMMVCLEDHIDDSDIAEICKLEPRVVVFKEDGFKDDNAKINAEYNLKKSGVEDVKCV